ncbi:hypothetical protein B0H15DRAFT_159239 [Mycena belliarum]|uniref:Uncharacterized protein n=1 Tax=Mycena belliarum TaxID=1033014 RepID=A0AAD6U860_9AGAR|nr:hypothetical protein B0H15DRAFT_159239 [Mycena belliae]
MAQSRQQQRAIPTGAAFSSSLSLQGSIHRIGGAPHAYLAGAATAPTQNTTGAGNTNISVATATGVRPPAAAGVRDIRQDAPTAQTLAPAHRELLGAPASSPMAKHARAREAPRILTPPPPYSSPDTVRATSERPTQLAQLFPEGMCAPNTTPLPSLGDIMCWTIWPALGARAHAEQPRAITPVEDPAPQINALDEKLKATLKPIDDYEEAPRWPQVPNRGLEALGNGGPSQFLTVNYPNGPPGITSRHGPRGDEPIVGGARTTPTPADRRNENPGQHRSSTKALDRRRNTGQAGAGRGVLGNIVNGRR